jgi:Domain of unknown function (DUF1990)
MLLILHALGARVYAGVRVGDAGNERRSEGGRAAQVCFWNYRTLEGHVEAGQRDFEVWKWLDSGEVEFRTHAVSCPATASPIVQLGFQLLGRHKQVEFGRHACSRMALLTEASLRSPEAAASPTTLDGRLLAIYLRDHHALLVALREMARRMRSGDRFDEQQAFADELCGTADDDLTCLEAFLGRLDRAPSRTRHAAVWTAEKVGRAKLNGRVLRRSPLSAVTELEGCHVLLESTRALWTGLEHLALGPTDAGERGRRVEQLLVTAEQLRLDALRRLTRQNVEPTDNGRDERSHPRGRGT